MPWWGWAVAAAILAFIELHAPGSYLVWIALGAALTAVIQAISELQIEGQVIAFVLCSALSCLAGYYVYRAVRGRPDTRSFMLNQRDRQMVGARGTVSARIIKGEGKVRVGDTVWLAEGPDLPEDTPVSIIAVRGARLIVKPDGD